MEKKRLKKFASNIFKVSSIEAMLKTKSYLYYYTQEKSVNKILEVGHIIQKVIYKIRKIKTIKGKNHDIN